LGFHYRGLGRGYSDGEAQAEVKTKVVSA